MNRGFRVRSKLGFGVSVEVQSEEAMDDLLLGFRHFSSKLSRK